MEVNSVLSGIQSSYVTTNKKTQNKTVENAELSEAQKLEAFKKEIGREIDSLPWNNSINWSIQITDGGWKRMMEEPEFRQQIMKVLTEDANVGRYPMSNAMITVNENGYSGSSYNFGYGEEAFEAHSNKKDCFYKKKAAKKINYEELWEKQQLENKKQQEISDRKYYNDLIRKRKLYQKQAIASRYEKGTLVTKA